MIALWIFLGILGLFLVYFLLSMLSVGIVFALLYGRTEHRYTRRAGFGDFPELKAERRTVTRGRTKLAVYLLGGPRGKGLVVISHGIRDRGEGYLTEARAFLALGYSVLLYDAVGSGNSGGRSQRGLPQSAIDLHTVLGRAEQAPEWEGLPIYLYGHSWGGYAVCAVFCLGEHPRVKAVCSLSGFDSPCRMLFESASVASRHFGRFIYPPMLFMQFLRFGTGMYRTAEQGIRRAQNVRFLILHAERDEAVNLERASIYSRRKALESPRVRFGIVEGREHNNAWLSQSSVEKDRAYDKKYAALAGKYGFRLSRKQEEEFFRGIDRAERLALSEPDMAFFEKIDSFYTEEGYEPS